MVFVLEYGQLWKEEPLDKWKKENELFSVIVLKIWKWRPISY